MIVIETHIETHIDHMKKLNIFAMLKKFALTVQGSNLYQTYKKQAISNFKKIFFFMSCILVKSLIRCNLRNSFSVSNMGMTSILIVPRLPIICWGGDLFLLTRQGQFILLTV